MKCGGNKSLMHLLELYGIDIHKIDKKILYNSRLLQYYRKSVRLKIFVKILI